MDEMKEFINYRFEELKTLISEVKGKIEKDHDSLIRVSESSAKNERNIRLLAAIVVVISAGGAGFANLEKILQILPIK